MRIVSLLPSATEIVAALGLDEGLVAISHECDFPASVTDRPRITDSILEHGLSLAEIDEAVRQASFDRRPIYSVDGAVLLGLAPELVVTQGVCSVCAVTEQTVTDSVRFARVDQQLDAPVLSLNAHDFAGMLDDIRLLGGVAGVHQRAESLVAALQARWDAIEPVEDAPRVAFVEWADPPWMGGHWVPEQVRRAGGVPLLGEAGQPSQRSTWEAIAAEDPDVVLIGACGFDVARNATNGRALLEHPVAGGLRAVREGRLWAVDANSYFSRPAPRLVRGAELLRAILAEDSAAIGAGEAQRIR